MKSDTISMLLFVLMFAFFVVWADMIHNDLRDVVVQLQALERK